MLDALGWVLMGVLVLLAVICPGETDYTNYTDNGEKYGEVTHVQFPFPGYTPTRKR